MAGIRSGTEEPAYEVVDRLGPDVEVRRYGPRLAAETTVADADDWQARSAAFKLLAGFIFGGNRPRANIAMTAPVAVAPQKIAMTVPVGTARGPGGLTMRFFMPAQYTRATLPEPSDARVRIVEVPEETVAVLRFTGSTGEEAVARHEAELTALLARSDWQSAGPAVALFYDPPWTLPFRRRNEVAVPVTPRS